MRTLAPGELPAFPPETAAIRAGDWNIAGRASDPGPSDVTLTGLDGYADAAAWAQDHAGEPAPGRVRVVCDTVFACFEAEEILYELREFNVGFDAAPLGYLFSFIRLFANAPECVMPDRRDITAGTPCIDAYLRHLNAACQRRGAQFESSIRPLRRLFADERPVEPADLLQVPRGRITRSGIRNNIQAVLRSLADPTVTADRSEAEFARAQLWQWVRHDTGVLDSGQIINRALFEALLDEERSKLAADLPEEVLAAAARLLLELTSAAELAPAMPLEGYRVAG